MLLAGAVLALAAHPVQAQRPELQSKISQSDRAAIADALRLKGRARVIVRYDERKLPLVRSRGGVRGRAGGTLRRAAIDRLHARAARRLSSRSLRSLRGMRALAAASVEVGAYELEALAAMPDVATVEPDVLLRPLIDDSGPLIGSDVANALGATGAGQMIVVADTGVDVTHPTIAGRLIEEACFGTNSDTSTSRCPGGEETEIGPGAAQSCAGSSCGHHGTAVAGIALGADPGFRGIAPEADLLALQIFSRVNDVDACNGRDTCLLAWTSDLLRALDYVYSLRNRYDIAAINLSAGGEPVSLISQCDSRNSVMKGMVDRLKRAGIATVIAAGNNGSRNGLSTPGCISSAITVGASDGFGSIVPGSNTASWLDLVAPGKNIHAPLPGGDWSSSTGTSVSTPHVTGALAALRSVSPEASVDELVAALYLTGERLLEPGMGFELARIDVAAATEALTTGTTPVNIVLDEYLNPDGQAYGYSSRVGSAYYGGTGRVSATLGTHSYRFMPSIEIPGSYRIYAWWNSHENASDRSVFTVNHRLGETALEVDQTIPSDGWMELGDFRLARGGGSHVVVSNPHGGSAVADALRLELLDEVDELNIHTTSLPEGRVGQRYFSRLRATGGSPSYLWSLHSGTLPDGVMLNRRGVLTGAPRAAGTHVVEIGVTDGFGERHVRSLRLTVQPDAVPDDPPDDPPDEPPGDDGSGGSGDAGGGGGNGTTTEIIVDNRDPNAGAISAGATWRMQFTRDAWALDSVYSDSPEARFRWAPNLPQTGVYDVYVWYTHSVSRSDHVPYTIRHIGGMNTVYLNQADGGAAGRWTLLGTYSFAGEDDYVEVSGINGQVSADAVRFVKR